MNSKRIKLEKCIDKQVLYKPPLILSKTLFGTPT